MALDRARRRTEPLSPRQMPATAHSELMQPRERALAHGTQALNEAELLALILRTGGPHAGAVQLAQALLTQFGSLDGVLRSPLERLLNLNGLGSAKATAIAAIDEICRRRLRTSGHRGTTFTSTHVTAGFLVAELKHHPAEVFAALFLDTRHRLIRFEKLFFGTIDAAPVYPREVVKRALAFNAAAVIVAHNHPSGEAEPSQADQHITWRLRDALSLMDIRLLDHFIVGDGAPVSMAERGML